MIKTYSIQHFSRSSRSNNPLEHFFTRLETKFSTTCNVLELVHLRDSTFCLILFKHNIQKLVSTPYTQCQN